tara:strand:+ start:855 stop:1505 length:651 start_codon:yes stop_codon:yes gene_type:complete
LAKRVSKKQLEEIIKRFYSGRTVDELSNEFNFAKLTITRNLKKSLGDEKYKNCIEKNKFEVETLKFRNDEEKPYKDLERENIANEVQDIESSFTLTSFVEITPLDQEIDHANQKDLSSVSIDEITFPKVVYMIVGNNIELNIKFLKDFPEWQFLPENDLKRKTIEIYYDLKNAKRFCKKDQKVIKVPNTGVFKLVAPILTSRGISRIVTSDKLIAL